MFSAQTGRKDIVELLIKAGADINIEDKNNKTAADLAAEVGFEEIVDLLTSVRTYSSS